MGNDQLYSCVQTKYLSPAALGPRLQGQHAIDAQTLQERKKSACEEKFLMNNPVGIKKSRSANRHLIFSAHASSAIFARARLPTWASPLARDHAPPV
jgi:hypothetical protein